jgi:hypothetical protein
LEGIVGCVFIDGEIVYKHTPYTYP